MKAKTDPKTRIATAILSDAEVATLCKAADLLTNVGIVETRGAAVALAQDIRKWIDDRETTEDQPKE